MADEPPMHLAPEDWAVLLRHLDEALELPPAERAAWWAALAPSLGALAPALRHLLDEREAIETLDFLRALPPLPHLPPGADPGAPAFAEGRRIGPYALLRELGQGGMASVWLAERADGAHRRNVALKLPWLGARARNIVERFAREREILSTLTHPHIASVLDAGVDGDQPWLALEYVQGHPITVHAASHGLGIAARLRLFLQVLQAVRHAHAQLVVHRDIKPANVLVDERGQVKLLDFGVAKLLADDGATQATELTQFGGRAMTPQYASPEQVAGHALGTASDVYSLGVLLYELLTGQLPYVLSRATPAALEEAILGAQLRPPSRVAGAPATARRLRGDLDTIVMKALAREPARRYASAEAFALDIERHLDSRPIEARRQDWHYRAAKLLARHRLGFAAGTAVAVAVLAGLGVALWQARIAQQEATRAQAVQGFLAATLSLNDPDRANGRALSARELLDQSALQIDARFGADAVVRAQLHHSVASIYVALGASEQARPHIDQAVALYEAHGERGTRRHVEALFTRMEVFEELSDFDAAREAALRTQAEAERAFGADNEWAARLLANRAWYDMHQGRFDRARALAGEALARQVQRSGTGSRDHLRVAAVAAHVYMETSDIQQAAEVFHQIRQAGDGIADYAPGDRLMDRYNLARARFVLSDYAGIEAELRELVPAMDKHFGSQHDRAIIGWLLLAQTVALQGHFDEGIALQRANLQRTASRGIAHDEQVAAQTLGLALVLKSAARFAEAGEHAARGLAHFEARYPQPTTYRERGRWILAESLLGQGRRDEGLALLRTVLGHAQAMGEGSALLLQVPATLSLAVAERRPGALEAACALQEHATGAGSLGSLRCRAIQAWLEALAAPDSGRAAALSHFVAARAQLFAALPPLHGLRAELLAAEAEIVAPAEPARATALRAQAAAEHQRVFGLPMPQPLLVLH